MPAGDEPQSSADDPWEAIVRANSAPEDVDGSGRRISLDHALVHCENRLGASWIYAPGRWETSDGFVPMWVVWMRFRTLRMARAIEAMDTARGIGLAFGGEGIGDQLTQANDEAFPEG